MMLQEIAEDRLNAMESWTVEKFDLLAELHELGLGRALGNAERFWGDDSTAWEEVRRSAKTDGDGRFVAFLSEDDGTKYVRPVDERHYFLARCHRDAARILREYGVSSEEELPDSDRQMFDRWLEIGERSAVNERFDWNEAVFVPIPQGATDKMLILLYLDYTPEELRGSAKANGNVDGHADLIAIGEQRQITAMVEGLRAQFGRQYRAEERIREHLKAGLTTGLAHHPSDQLRPGSSDRRLIAVSRQVLRPEQHEELVAEIEAEFPGWCRECGTMPGLVGCAACQPARGSAGGTSSADAPF